MPAVGPVDINEIQKILPHRYPFLLIDRIISVDLKSDGKSHLGSSLKAIKNVTINEPFFNGHFPGNPIMPGVLIIEAMAQAAAVLGHRPHPSGRSWTFLILGVDGARWRKPVIPGDQLTLEVKMIKDRGSLFVFECKAYVAGEMTSEAEIMAKMV